MRAGAWTVGLVAVIGSACSGDDGSWEAVVLEVDFPADVRGWLIDNDPASERCRFEDIDTNRFSVVRHSDGENALPQSKEIAHAWRHSRPIGSASGRVVDQHCRTIVRIEVTTTDPVDVTLVSDGETIDTFETRSITWHEVGGAEADWSSGSPWRVDVGDLHRQISAGVSERVVLPSG